MNTIFLFLFGFFDKTLVPVGIYMTDVYWCQVIKWKSLTTPDVLYCFFILDTAFGLVKKTFSRCLSHRKIVYTPQ